MTSPNPIPPRLDAEELRQLRAIAEAAAHDWNAVQIGVGGGMRGIETVPAYISAFDPPTILALIDALAQPAEGGSGQRAEGARQGWQPIEEAPKDTDVLLGWWSTSYPEKWVTETGWAACANKYEGTGYSNAWIHGHATRWMPLPPPPSPAQEEEA